MEAQKPVASGGPKSTGKSDANAVTTTDATAKDSNDKSTTTTSGSEDFLIFGARPSNLFDDIAITIDSLLTEEVATLPLLPRTLTDAEQRQHQTDGSDNGGQKPQTGEQKLIGKLRKAYKKNIDLAEAYCSRNIFTVQSFSKTKRRKILETYMGEEDSTITDGERNNDGTSEKDTANNDNEHVQQMPESTFKAPEGELPSPEQIMGMDKEILETRQRLQHEKQKRIQLKRQLGRLNKASQTLIGVQEALKQGLNSSKITGGEGGATSMISTDKLKESVTSAMEGHEELKVWNSRAEEVIEILDKIKVERDEENANNKPGGGKPSATAGDNGSKKVGGREADERDRKRMLEEMGIATSGAGSHGTKEQVDSLLNKLRGN